MIRKGVDELSATPDPLTLRSVVEWFKTWVASPYNPLTVEEREYVDGRFGSIVGQLAKEHDLPVGWLGYMLSELAKTEMQMVRVAAQESGLQ